MKAITWTICTIIIWSNTIYYLVTKGRNEIVRRSADSSVTIPHDVTFRNLDNNRPAAGSQSETEFNFCGCGWPQHMLIPKGTSEGYPCQLFVMITNGFDDQVWTLYLIVLNTYSIIYTIHIIGSIIVGTIIIL